MDSLLSSLRDFWEKGPKIFRQVVPAGELLDPFDLFSIFASAEERIHFKDRDFSHEFENPFTAYLNGCSVVINHVDNSSLKVYETCKSLRSHFPHIFANMYLTPTNSQAVKAHSDDRDVLVLQMIGSKRWHVYSDPIRFPYSDEQLGKGSATLSAEERGPLTLCDTLHTGDVLYIPRGFVHEADTGAEPSLHVTFAIPTHDFTWLSVIAETLRDVGRRLISPRQSVSLEFWNASSASAEDAFRAVKQSLFEGATFERAQELFLEKIRRHNLAQDSFEPSLRQAEMEIVRRRSHSAILPDRNFLLQIEGKTSDRVVAVFARVAEDRYLRWNVPDDVFEAVRDLWQRGCCEWRSLALTDDIARYALAVCLDSFGVAKLCTTVQFN